MAKIFNLTHRQAKIFAAIVKDHCETGQPVASKELVGRYHFDLSAATVRNEMQVLEKQGLISQPHTSAGRVPTDEGLRYFINELMERVKLSMREQEKLRGELLKLQAVNVEIGRRLVKMLSVMTNQASFAVLPEEISSAGFSNILENPALPSQDAKEIANFFDSLDERAEAIIKEYGGQTPQAFIGKELKLSKNSDYSMIVSGVKLPSGKQGVVGLIGPKSMHYEKNLSLLDYLAKFLGGGAAVLLFILLR